ncbi:Ser-Thr-rich glycosyl-phosphatidyl-inositol-anchored membrane family-domain-containing protein [Fennellomyces sp. T-0311]|nr:Ser-Thr-rich glycosyl-phosphatidyl-inositol-anchored membrane family-domain-containing protein [Fennellomyces sp. T-0311]
MKSATFATLVALFLAIAGVIAQDTTPFYTTNPTSASQFTAGETVTIRWANGIDEEIIIKLREGANENALGDTGISFTVDGSAGSYEWTIPSDLAASSNYALEFVNAADGTIYNYSARFTINAGSVTASSSPATSSSVAASSTSSPASSSPASTTSSRPSGTQTQTATETADPEEDGAAALGLTAFALLAPALIAGVLAA